MTTLAIITEIQSHYLRLKQASAEARFWYEHYLDDLQARFQQSPKEMDRTYLAA